MVACRGFSSAIRATTTRKRSPFRDWLEQEGWNDIFLDLDPERGIKAGERWERRAPRPPTAARRCCSWSRAPGSLRNGAAMNSDWPAHLRQAPVRCLDRRYCDRRSAGEVTREWQVVSIAPAGETKTFSVTLPRSSQRWRSPSVLRGSSGLRPAFSRLGSMPTTSPGRRRTTRSGRPIAACDRSKPTMPASSSAARRRSSRRSTGCAACARRHRRGSSSSSAHPAPASRRSCAPACCRGSRATTATSCRCR